MISRQEQLSLLLSKEEDHNAAKRENRLQHGR